MLDRLFLKYLSKKGKIAYWVGQVLLLAIWALYVFQVDGYTYDNGGDSLLIIGFVAILIGWGFVCLMLWKKPKDEENETLSRKI